MGEVRVLGKVPFANAKVHEKLGYCPEGDRFFGEMRCEAFVRHLLLLSGYTRAEAAERAERALEEVEMTWAAGKRLAACSKGMRQRVKLAQSIAHDPEILLLDEPLSGLDPVARHHTQALIRKRAEAGATVLVSSHVLHEVEDLTNRVLLVNRGRIAATGEVAEIRSVLDSHPHRIRLDCEEPRRLAALLVDREEVRSLHMGDGVLTVETANPNRFYETLPDLVVEHRLPITGITSPDDHLKAVFDLLVRGGEE
jgi:ABC-2 type transport system ATP-binding protein